MRYLWVVTLLVGCGKVSASDPSDAAPDPDGATCAGTDVDACGDECAVCEAFDPRTVRMCVNRECGAACVDGVCSDQTCSKLIWEFVSGTVDGVTARAPAGLQLSVRNHLGSQALAADVTSLAEISFRVPICNSGTANLENRAFSMDVFFEKTNGATGGPGNYFAQVSVPDPVGGTFLGQPAVTANQPFTYTATIPSNTDAQTATEITVQAGTFGEQFAGTIWFDNITIQ
jgi:hypothetical protein